MELQFCQSCGMPLTDENKGTNADGSRSEDYCVYCYKNGEFTQEFTMSQMIEFCLQFLDQWNVQTECKLTPIQAKEQMLQHFPHLKRWKVKDERTLTEKATHLLTQCENVTVASIDANGYPRPVQMSKIGAKEFHEVWMATSADSVKVHDFKANNKAGLCYDHYGDGVALRGTVEVVTDDAIRKEMWQDWFIHHFPGGANDPNYVLLHFIGAEATFLDKWRIFSLQYLTFMKTIVSDTQNIAACGLYCGACRKFLAEKCPGCKHNEKATWCKIRACCQENKFNTCAECSHDVKECKLFSNWIGKVFAFLFNSDRPACIRYIKEQGEQAFAEEMTKRKCQTIKRK